MSQPPKIDVAHALLERGSLFVHLDPRIDGVVVPRHFAIHPQLVLQFGLNLPVPIPDLEVDDEGVFGTLSFSRSPFYCRIPWASVFGLVGDDGMGVVWPEDLPAEVAAEVEVAKEKAARRPALRAIEGGAASASEDDDGAAADEVAEEATADRRTEDETPRERPSGPPKLRLVK